MTRVRDELTMVVDDRKKLERQLDLDPGNKTSALETVGRLNIDGNRGPASPAKFDPGPIEGLDLTDHPDMLTKLPPVPDGRLLPATAMQTGNGATPDDIHREDDLLPPLPERSPGFDL